MLELIGAIVLGTIAYLLLELFLSDGEVGLHLSINGKDIINYHKNLDEEKEPEEKNNQK